MLKRRFLPYIVGFCIVAFLSVSYVGYRAYQNHVDFKAFMSNAQAFNRSVEHDETHEHVHVLGEHTHGEKNTHSPAAVRSSSSLSFFQGKQGEEYVYEINGFPVYSNMPLSQEQIELREWVQTGKMTPAVEEQFAIREQYKLNVAQRVVTPDEKLHQVIVPRDSQYEEGDAILRSELVLLSRREAAKDGGSFSLEGAKLMIDGIEYPYPDEYYSIADPYERLEYTNKFAATIELDIPMDEAEKKIAAGELDVSLSESEKRFVGEQEAIAERFKMLSLESPSLSDKRPVKVSFLPDEGDGALPGWMRKNSEVTEVTESVIERVNERGINEDTDFPPFHADVPFSPSDLPGMVEPTPSRRNEVELEASKKTAPLSAESIETQLKERLSSDRFDKAQQLIDQYGSEEGLRRLREMDPDAARRFERERGEPPVPSESDDKSSTQ